MREITATWWIPHWIRYTTRLLPQDYKPTNLLMKKNFLRELNALGQSTEGRMQAIQVGNMVATEQVAQTQKLRQLMATQINAQNAYMAHQVSQEAQAQANTEYFYEIEVETPEDYGQSGFNADNIFSHMQ